CYVTFPPECSPIPGKWSCPTAFRVNEDSVITYDAMGTIPYPERDWYIGALKCGENEGYWSLPYNDGTHEDPVFTYSQKVYDGDGKLMGVAGSDYTLVWTGQLLEDILPYDDAVCQLFSADGTLIVGSGEVAKSYDMIVFEKVLSPTDMRLVISVPKCHIREDIARISLITLAVLLSGVLIIGLLLYHIRREHDALVRVQTTNKLMEKEMQIAHDIQMGILKGDGLQVAGDGVQLEAKLIPMREVGGDLYDFRREKDDLWFIIGDVSGKGVPAAMFMSAAVNLFRAAGARANSPKQIMEEMNTVLSENNPSFTFVTAFIGCLHIPTGELLYCNAGHCPPLHLTPYTVHPLPIEPNIPLGYDAKFRFVEQGCMLGQGETLVLYTDGVTEARNSAREMLGMKRWSDIVAKNKDLLQAIKQYTGEAEPTDDITLMTITKTSAVQPLTLRVECNIDCWPELRTALHNFGFCAGMNPRVLKKTEMAIEELVVNIVNYSGADWMELEVSGERVSGLGDERLVVTLRDNGGKFDPTQQAEVDTDAVTAERQIGGLGIALVRQIADELSYRRVNAVNELIILKNI
ncbi:MAG: SpoIIE family protein phosphatase, partial [Paludibacteraceae bacterium]|nr:SpoIIE family protein phosphatase [Paludibacteraceae bacterium]